MYVDSEAEQLRSQVWGMINSNLSGCDARLRFALLDLHENLGGSTFAPFAALPPLIMKPTKPKEVIDYERELELGGGT